MGRPRGEAPRTRAPQLAALRGFVLVPNATALPRDTWRLDEGERQVIAIALSRSPGAVALIDERAGRAVAVARGLRVVGTLGVLVEGKRRGLLDSVHPRIERLLAAGFRLGGDVVAAALAAVGESKGPR